MCYSFIYMLVSSVIQVTHWVGEFIHSYMELEKLLVELEVILIHHSQTKKGSLSQIDIRIN